MLSHYWDAEIKNEGGLTGKCFDFQTESVTPELAIRRALLLLPHQGVNRLSTNSLAHSIALF
jgi:hypothetical protein